MENKNKHKVLLVSREYYPSGGIGAHRAGKFSKYLREFGWEPTILCIKEKYYPLIDDGLKCQIPEGIKVIRSGYLGVDALKWFLSSHH